MRIKIKQSVMRIEIKHDRGHVGGNAACFGSIKGYNPELPGDISLCSGAGTTDSPLFRLLLTLLLSFHFAETHITPYICHDWLPKVLPTWPHLAQVDSVTSKGVILHVVD
jgi:hypothetical protein